MGKRFADLSMERQEQFVETLMEIKSESERCVIEIVKGTNIELTSTLSLIKKHLSFLESLLD